jgi:hypothetical protein
MAAISLGVAGVVIGGAALYQGYQAGEEAKDVAEDVKETAIKNIKFLAEQGIDAANILGEGGKETLSRLGLTADGSELVYGGGLPEGLRAIIDPVMQNVGGAFDLTADMAFNPEMAEEGSIQELISGRTSKRVLDEFSGQSPAVQKEIMRLSEMEGRKAQKGTLPFLERASGIEAGAQSDISNIEARNTSRLASILQNVPAQQANVLLGQTGQGIPFVETANEASALGDAASRVATNANIERISEMVGGL